MPRSKRWLYAVFLLMLGAGCHHAPPNVRFAPPGTAVPRLGPDLAPRRDGALRPPPDSIRDLTKKQIDKLNQRPPSGRIPDGPFRGDLFFPKDATGPARRWDVADPVPPLL